MGNEGRPEEVKGREGQFIKRRNGLGREGKWRGEAPKKKKNSGWNSW